MKLGAWGEQQALNFLQSRGYILLARNVHVGSLELDLVMQQQDMVVFVEVKTRTSTDYGTPEEAVSFRKQQLLQRAAWGFLEEHQMLQAPWRIDVIAIVATSAQEVLRLDHYPAAFDVSSI
ncbi:MAG: YraN family protein [Anaerolineales bacterium]